MQVNMVYITDEKYVLPTKVSIRSLIKNSGEITKYSVFVIAVELSEKSCAELEELRSKNVSVMVKSVKKNSWIRRTFLCKQGGVIQILPARNLSQVSKNSLHRQRHISPKRFGRTFWNKHRESLCRRCF